MLLPCSLGASFLTMLPAPSDDGGAAADWIVLLPCMYLDQIVHDQPLPAALCSIVLPLRNNSGGVLHETHYGQRGPPSCQQDGTA